MTAMLFPYKEQSRAIKDKKIGGVKKTVVVEKVILKVVKTFYWTDA